MDEANLSVAAVAHVIQLSVAPVFLLAGISGLLVVLTNRLARIVDRVRSLQSKAIETLSNEDQHLINKELHSARKRSLVINFAIAMATLSALLICLVIITLFMESGSGSQASDIISNLFVFSMILLALAFSSFLIEVFISSGYLILRKYN